MTAAEVDPQNDPARAATTGADCGIQAVHGLMISFAFAADLVAALDRLATLAAPKGARLTPRLTAGRDHMARAIAYADASAEVVAVPGALAFERDAITDTKTVANMLDITTDGVRWLCRNGRLEAELVAGRWLIGLASVYDYQLHREREGTGAEST